MDVWVGALALGPCGELVLYSEFRAAELFGYLGTGNSFSLHGDGFREFQFTPSGFEAHLLNSDGGVERRTRKFSKQGRIPANALFSHRRVFWIQLDQDGVALQPIRHEPRGAGAAEGI